MHVSITWPGAGVAALLLLVTACGDDAGGESGGFPQGTTCGAALEVNGGLDLSISPSRTSTGCVSSVSHDSGFAVGFLFVDSELASARVEIENVTEGETGEDFPAQLSFVHDDDREWSVANCVAEVTEHEYVAPNELGWKRYRVSGSVECTSASSVDERATEALDVRSFAFIATISWG